MIWRLNNFSYLQPLSETHLLSMKWTQQQICRRACQKKMVLFGGNRKKKKVLCKYEQTPEATITTRLAWDPEGEKNWQNLVWQKKLNSSCRGKEAVVSHQSLCSVCQDPNSFTEFKGFIVKNHVGALLDLTCLCSGFLPHRRSLFWGIPPLTAECKHSKSRFQRIIRKTT